MSTDTPDTDDDGSVSVKRLDGYEWGLTEVTINCEMQTMKWRHVVAIARAVANLAPEALGLEPVEAEWMATEDGDERLVSGCLYRMNDPYEPEDTP